MGHLTKKREKGDFKLIEQEIERGRNVEEVSNCRNLGEA